MIEELKYYGSLCIFAACLMTIVLSWPISEIIIGIYYKDQLICPSYNPEITLDNWLIIKGSTTITMVLVLSTLTVTVKNTPCNCLVNIMLWSFNIFNGCWIIFGSYLFWGHCTDLTPNNINIYMWFSLIFSYLFMLNSAKLQKSIEVKKSKSPLLDIA